MTAVVTDRKSRGKTPLVTIDGLRVEFLTPVGWGRAVDDVSLTVHKGQTLAVIGESGSGKSALARALMGVLPQQGSRISAGRIELDGVDLLGLDAEARRRTCGPEVAMIFQDAMSALNPVLPVGYQIGEGCRIHDGMSRRAARRRALELLELVGIPDAETRIDHYPHHFSGGMRQRIMIAMAIASDPAVLIADEPTTALDVTVQAQILNLLGDLQRKRRMSLILITHDMGVVAGMADAIVVMYAGKVVEEGPADEIYDRPAHPYTRALLASIPQPSHRGQALPMIGGHPPELTARPGGCPFRPRCPQAMADCVHPPPTVRVGPGHRATCFLATQAHGG